MFRLASCEAGQPICSHFPAEQLAIQRYYDATYADDDKYAGKDGEGLSWGSVER